MRSVRVLRVGLITLAEVAIVGGSALAQGMPAARPGGEAGGGMLLAVLMIVLLAIIGIGVKLYDMRRKRSDEAMSLQARISDALMLDPVLATLPVAAAAHAPFWHRSPVTIEVTGHVPSPALREAAMNAVRGEAIRAGVEVQIEDRLAVIPRAA